MSASLRRCIICSSSRSLLLIAWYRRFAKPTRLKTRFAELTWIYGVLDFVLDNQKRRMVCLFALARTGFSRRTLPQCARKASPASASGKQDEQLPLMELAGCVGDRQKRIRAG